jgi:hypothetical protein
MCLTPEDESFVIDAYIERDRHAARKMSRELKLAIGILGTNKAIHHEATEILYGQKFEFSGTRAHEVFLHHLSTDTAQLLRNIIFHYSYYKDRPADFYLVFGKLHVAFNLQRLWIHSLECNKSAQPENDGKMLARKVLRDSLLWCRHMAKTKQSPTAAMKILRLHPDTFHASEKTKRGELRKEAFEKELRGLLEAELGMFRKEC